MKRPTVSITTVSGKEIKLTQRVMDIVNYAFANPELTQKQLAAHFVVSEVRISNILRSQKVLAAFPILARTRLKGMLPMAMKRLDHLMRQNDNLAVSEKVVARVLDSEKVLNSPEITHNHVLNTASIDELRRIVGQASVIPADVIDAELVNDVPKQQSAIQGPESIDGEVSA